MDRLGDEVNDVEVPDRDSFAAGKELSVPLGVSVPLVEDGDDPAVPTAGVAAPALSAGSGRTATPACSKANAAGAAAARAAMFAAGTAGAAAARAAMFAAGTVG